MTRMMFLLLVGLSCMGCASMSDYRFRYATERQARMAWLACKANLNEFERTADCADGFKAGYVDVTRGGDGACPVVPPPCYWEAKFQTPEGKVRLDRWYAGFAMGAATALQCHTHRNHNVPSRFCMTSACTLENMPSSMPSSTP